MNITILGAGAIGSLWAVKLRQAGHNVTLWLRGNDAPTHELCLDKQQPISFATNDIESLRDSDLLLVSVKAWQVKEAIKPLREHLNPDTIILFMHNGMGAIDEVAPSLSGHPIVIASTTQAAYKPDPSTVLHTGRGTTTLGGFNQAGNQCAFLAEVLDHALEKSTWSDEIERMLWNKLAINCAINPLTAINQCLNGELLEPGYQDELEAIIEEVAAVMRAEQYEVSTHGLLKVVLDVARATAQNHSSMRQDIFHKRKTEIDYITGYLCAVADKHHIPVAKNRALYQKINQIQDSWSSQ